ncbi:hypothetical protein D3C81_1754890 [compost metagenome]
MREQAVIRREQITQIVFAGNAGQRNPGTASVPAQVEGQTHTPETGDAFGPLQITLLTTAPTVDKQHARHFRFGTEKGPAHLFIINVDLNAFASSRHRI